MSLPATSPATDVQPLAADPLAERLPADKQRQAAALVQETFAQVFRLSVGDEPVEGPLGLLQERLGNWCRAGGDADAEALRLALLASGLDQWGLAYTQAFGLVGIPALTTLLGGLRSALDVAQDARFQQQFALLDAQETAALDFKADTRRQIHLALWHAMISGEERDDALLILTTLGGQLLALTRTMPHLGWRLVADALSHIQLRCLADGLAQDGLGQETTQALFESLRQAMPKNDYDRIMAHATQAVLAWQASRRPH